MEADGDRRVEIAGSIGLVRLDLRWRSAGVGGLIGPAGLLVRGSSRALATVVERGFERAAFVADRC
jgi:hypothetical protein